jgi:hypothetical protein
MGRQAASKQCHREVTKDELENIALAPRPARASDHLLELLRKGGRYCAASVHVVDAMAIEAEVRPTTKRLT